jgi:nitrate/TMAO reductase-like tetraheme cytochrome c subunit
MIKWGVFVQNSLSLLRLTRDANAMAQIRNSPPTPKNQKRPAARALRIGLILVLVVMIPLTLTVITGLTAMQFENHDSFCASCHTQNESVYYQRESAPSLIDLASFHETKNMRCIDCHSGNGSLGRAGALMLGARDLMAFVSGHYAQPAPVTRPIGDGNCLKCHANISQGQDFNNHFHTFLPQWQARDPNAATCVTCHQGHATDGQASIAYLNQSSTERVCQRCHSFAGAGN